MSKAGDTAKGLGKGLDPASTRAAGLKPLSAAEAAAEAKKAGLGAAGKGGGGGGGVGGLGKAVGPEGALSARSAASLSAAERAIASEQSARATPTGTAGAPMSGRGVAGSGGQGESDGKRKSARYLQSEENGEEIVGELPGTAPSVLGGLNLDTSDNAEPAKESTQR